MQTKITNTSIVASPNIRVYSNSTDALNKALATYRTSSAYKNKIRQLFFKLDKQVEQVIVQITGGKVVNKQSIVNPVFTTTLDIRKDFTNDISIRNDSTITKINITKDTISTSSSDDDTFYNKELISDINRLKNNPSALFSVLLANETTKRLISNYNSINLDIKYSGKTTTKSIRFTDSDIIAGIKEGRITISVESKAPITTISIRLKVDTLVKAINSANSLIVKELSGSLGRTIAKIIAEETALPSSAAMSDVRTFLESIGLGYVLRYVQGAEVNRTQLIEKTISNKEVGYQSFLSTIQWTALVQARLGKSMERLGEPDPPDIKERTGRFRSSVLVSPDYKRDKIRFTYMPLYTSLERYGYNPDLQVKAAITEVAQQQFGRAFKIIEKI